MLKVKKWITSLRKTLAPMRWSQRLEYIFSYYAEIAFVLCIAGVLITVLLVSVLKDRSEVIFGGAFANTDINREGYAYLTDGVMTLLHGDPETQKVALSSTAFKETPDAGNINGLYNAAMKPVAQADEGTVDYIVMNESAMMFYMPQYVLADLTQVFSEEELAQMGEKVIYLELTEEGIRCPVAVRVDSLAFFRDCVDVREPIYLGFVDGGKRTEKYRIFWEYLKSWDPDTE